MIEKSKEDDILIPGVQVFHRNLRLHGVVVEPWFWGLILDSVLVDFEDGETREVSRHLLDIE